MSKIRNLTKAVCVENEKVPRPPNLLKDDKNFDEGHRLLESDENYGKAFGVPSCVKFEDGQRSLRVSSFHGPELGNYNQYNP